MAKRTNVFERLMRSSRMLENENVDDPEPMSLRIKQEEATTSNTLITEEVSEEVENPTLVLQHHRVIYNFFNKLSDSQSICDTCKKVLKCPSSTITTLVRHLKTHTKQYLKYQTYIEEKKNVKEEENQGLKRKHEDNSQQTIQNSFKSNSYLSPNSPRAMLITKKIGEMIALDY